MADSVKTKGLRIRMEVIILVVMGFGGVLFALFRDEIPFGVTRIALIEYRLDAIEERCECAE